ncbi:MAG TPA: hypothetical protein VEC99_09595 [Clostridia bacterium]|nr:hypothetical protein [Clostridia bacterium]
MDVENLFEGGPAMALFVSPAASVTQIRPPSLGLIVGVAHKNARTPASVRVRFSSGWAADGTALDVSTVKSVKVVIEI